MHRLIQTLAAVVVVAVSVATAKSATPQPARVEYKAGQVWRYTTDGPTVTVLKVEDLPKSGRVIHVRVDDIPVRACAGIHLTKAIDHIAITERMMRQSVRDLLRERTDLPDSYFDSYREWEKQKKPRIVKDATIEDLIRRDVDLPLICNLLPDKTT